MSLKSNPPHEDDELELRISRLLADPDYCGHPLRQALEDLVERLSMNVARLERITKISDRYQAGVQESFRNLSCRYDRQITRLEKAIRISDRYQKTLNDLNRALQEASTHDSLTSLPNRKLMADFCRREDELVVREGSTYCLLAIDADRFKTINDSYGHEVGDNVLICLARSLQGGVRDGDICSRWGGEEFLALLSGADICAAQSVANRLLSSVRLIKLDVGDAWIMPRVSIGIAQHTTGETYLDVYRRADAALLRAKKSGRDRFVLASESHSSQPQAIRSVM